MTPSWIILRMNKRWCLWKVSIYIIDLGTDFKSVIGTTYWCSMVNLCHHLSCLFVCLFLVGFWFFGKGGGAFSNLNHQYADYQRKMFAEVQYSNNINKRIIQQSFLLPKCTCNNVIFATCKKQTNKKTNQKPKTNKNKTKEKQNSHNNIRICQYE